MVSFRFGRRGVHTSIRVDNGMEITAKEMHRWAHSKGVRLDFRRPGKPTDNQL